MARFVALPEKAVANDVPVATARAIFCSFVIWLFYIILYFIIHYFVYTNSPLMYVAAIETSS